MKKHLLLLGIALASTSALHAQNAIGEVFSSDASVRGSVVLSGNGAHVMSGSQVSAGDATALLKLSRGGEVRICPKTKLSLSEDQSAGTLVLGLNAGSMELNYTLSSASDSLITPDLRLQLISPGSFHLAISVAASGDTCLRSLPGNDASVFVAEMMGNGAYQLSPGKNVMFRGGRISGATEAPPVCGCPEMAQLMVSPLTAAPTVPPPAPVTLPANLPTAPSEIPSAALELPPSKGTSAAASAAPVQGNAGVQHLEVEGSFVYHGDEVVHDYYAAVARLSLSTDNSKLALALLPQVSKPAVKNPPPEKKPGLLHRFGSIFGKLFRK